jgi:hypothetical protein
MGGRKMAVKKNAKKSSIKLTPEQLKQIAEAFGQSFAKRVRSLEVDQIEGFVRANVKVN